MKNTMKYILFITALLINTQNVFAQDAFEGERISAIEMFTLPPFCRALSEGHYQESAKPLRIKMKLPGSHSHHFCAGLKYFLRQNYNGAIKEFQYVEAHSANNQIEPTYAPSALYHAESLNYIGNTQGALNQYNKAIEIDKKYGQAYLKLANYYLKLNMKPQAIETLEKGIKNASKTKFLQKKLDKIKTKK